MIVITNDLEYIQDMIKSDNNDNDIDEIVDEKINHQRYFFFFFLSVLGTSLATWSCHDDDDVDELSTWWKDGVVLKKKNGKNP